MMGNLIPVDDPRHAAAQAVIDAMHAYWKLDPSKGAVRWIEDTTGRLIVFTRGEYKQAIRDAIAVGLEPEEYFDTRQLASPECENCGGPEEGGCFGCEP